MKISYSVTPEDSGKTVYQIMKGRLHFSASLIRRLKHYEAIFLNGEEAYTIREVSEGDVLSVDISACEEESDAPPQDGPLSIVYEDDIMLAVNKPSGMIVHPSRSRLEGTLLNYVVGYANRTCSDAHCHVVNRLDRDTSGIVLIAKSGYHKAMLTETMKQACKEYTAVALGAFDPPCGRIEKPIRRMEEGNMLRITSPDGRYAATNYVTAAVSEVEGQTVSVLKLRLETGRTHQIRVHCLSCGHPLLGDILYYTPESKALSESLGLSRQLLHAGRLSFRHPVTGEYLDLTAEPEERNDFKEIFLKINC